MPVSFNTYYIKEMHFDSFSNYAISFCKKNQLNLLLENENLLFFLKYIKNRIHTFNEIYDHYTLFANKPKINDNTIGFPSTLRTKRFKIFRNLVSSGSFSNQKIVKTNKIVLCDAINISAGVKNTGPKEFKIIGSPSSARFP